MFNSNWNNNAFYDSQPSGNIVYVTSPEEALMRSNNRGTENVYFDQSKPVFYRVKVDFDGRKSWAPFTYNVNTVDNTSNASNISRDEFDALVKEVKDLRSKLQSKEEATNA